VFIVFMPNKLSRRSEDLSATYNDITIKKLKNVTIRKIRRTDQYKDMVMGTLHVFQCVDNSLFLRQKCTHTLSIYMSKKTDEHGHNVQSIHVHRLMKPRERTVASIRLGPCKMLRC